jgi:ectonucleotide pyrophosphatase/phosphodiesterase family protein 5
MKLLIKIFCFLLLFQAILFSQAPYTILISFDGFRHDYMDRGLTPNLWKVASNGVKALSLMPVYPSKTFPNHTSIITGMYPENHGIIANTIYDPYFNETFKISDPVQVRNPRWYKGEAFWETAQRNGITAASFFWPGSEVILDYRRPKYFKDYDHDYPYKPRVDGLIDWLQLPLKERPRFLTIYFDATDSYGHKYGPNSDSVNYAISVLDGMAGYLMDKLKEINLLDSTNLIFVSDHGMTEVSSDKYVNLEEILGDEKVDYWNWSTFCLIQPEKGRVEAVYNKLKANEEHYKVYRKSEVPDFYRFSNNPFFSELIVITDLGWEAGDSKAQKGFISWKAKGNHGYEKDALDMHGYFVAMGPSFRKNYKTGTLRNIDIYPLLCEIFDIPVRNGIDGNGERIRFILKKY